MTILLYALPMFLIALGLLIFVVTVDIRLKDVELRTNLIWSRITDEDSK